jgi:FkbM family methyltransferase
MTFISYSQNFEDVMLWRALKHVENGFYIDVGAGHPDIDSVTRAFSDRGWTGINIEPSVEFYTRLAAARGRDTNLNLAVGCEPGSVTFFEIPGSGLSTLDPTVAATHRSAGWTINQKTIEQMSLAEVCHRYVHAEIHFLKVDVEGSEASVLAGADFTSFRPWIVLTEATRPLSEKPSHADWEPVLVSAGYHFAWFDGLNRFYIADERWELLSHAFTVPPNVFDDFIRATDTQDLNRIMGAEARAFEATRRADKSEADAAQTTARAQAVEAQAQVAEEQAQAAEARAQAAEGRAQAAEARAQVADARAQVADARAQAADARAQAADARAREATDRAAQEEMRAAAAAARAQAAEAHAIWAKQCRTEAVAKEAAAQGLLEAMRASTSWQVTAPLRTLFRLLRGQ